jgi:hypothetical protein
LIASPSQTEGCICARWGINYSLFGGTLTKETPRGSTDILPDETECNWFKSHFEHATDDPIQGILSQTGITCAMCSGVSEAALEEHRVEVPGPVVAQQGS